MPSNYEETHSASEASEFGWHELTEDHQSISKDETFAILSSQRRRYALHYLQQQDKPAYLRDVTDCVAAWEYNESVNEINSKKRKRVYTSLQQVHLPKMHRLGLIKFDRQSKLISLTPTADELDVYLDVVSEDDIPWHFYYAGLSAIVGTIGVGIWIDIPPLSVLPGSVWIILTSTVLALSALIHSQYSQQMRLGASGSPSEVDTDDR